MLVTDAGCTVNAAARQLRIPLRLAASFLKTEAVEFKRHHHGLNQPIEDELIPLLVAGEGLYEIASKLNVRKSLIISYLARNPELQNNWRKSVHRRLNETHRSLFLQFMAENPGLPATSIRRSPESGFQWLKINDRDWLKQHLPGIWKVPSPQAERSDDQEAR